MCVLMFLVSHARLHPASCTAGTLSKALDLEVDEDLSPGESGDIRSADELLGDGGLDDLIGEGFSAGEDGRPAVTT